MGLATSDCGRVLISNFISNSPLPVVLNSTAATSSTRKICQQPFTISDFSSSQLVSTPRDQQHPSSHSHLLIPPSPLCALSLSHSLILFSHHTAVSFAR